MFSRTDRSFKFFYTYCTKISIKILEIYASKINIYEDSGPDTEKDGQ